MATQYTLNILIMCFSLISGLTTFGFRKPHIVSDSKDLIIDANDNYTIYCEGAKPLKWTVPEISDTISWTNFSIQQSKGTTGYYPYASTLHIINMTFPFVGFYYCHYKGFDKNDESGSASIYLYVNDTEHLTADLEENNDVMTIVVTQYQEAVLPCKPTSPYVNVSFSKINGIEVHLNKLSNLDTMYWFNPKYGIFTNDTKEETTIFFTCKFVRESKVSLEQDVVMKVEKPISHLPKPYLNDTNGGHTVEGSQLILDCIIKTENAVDIHWKTPRRPIDKSRMSISQKTQNIAKDKQKHTLTINNATAEDRGVYTCKVTDRQNHNSQVSSYVNIFGIDYNFLDIINTGASSSITVMAGEHFVKWNILVYGHPSPTVTWLNNMNETIALKKGNKYEAYYDDQNNATCLVIKNISITDMGYYKLTVNNSGTNRVLKLFLNVTVQPSVHIETDQFHLINTPSKVRCVVYAYPEPEILLEYRNCQTDECNFLLQNATLLKKANYTYISETTIKSSTSGTIKCKARNNIGYGENTTEFYISDVKNGFDIFDFDSKIHLNEDKMVATVAIGEIIKMTCGASVYNYSDIKWFFNDKLIENKDRHTISKSHTQFSNKIRLSIPEANYTDSGLYSCQVTKENGKHLFKNISFHITNPTAPVINLTNMKGEKEMNIPDKLVMTCEAFGVPKPIVTWFKDGAVFNAPQSNRISISEDNQKIVIVHTEAKDEGTYKCEVRNKMGIASMQQTVKFSNIQRNQVWLIYIIVFLSILFVTAIIYILIKIRKERELQRELKSIGLENFKTGAVKNINPELGIDDQAELLPYDQEWEFPIENLKLGKQLGSGAFGVVMKGEAKNITEEEDVTIVAVKMVKKNADHTYIKALASELKIMVHLGKHLNIVNLLGACTKNVAKRELLVIVEYCRFGNLQNYLLRHRDLYIDQVDPKTDKIDFRIGQEHFNRSYSVSSDGSSTQSPSLKYVALSFSNLSNRPLLPISNSMGDYRKNAVLNSGGTEINPIPEDEGVVLSNNSIQPEWRSNYRGDYRGNVKPICTKDLLAWAFQVSRGMEYLASRKVLHGDLAARNILLADGNIVKICDFGLAKSMYKNENYKKRSDGPLPLKWMAIESIGDRIFSTQSDVWSFGVVLWEFFSLGRTPYPGMEANERLYQKLVDGYRMESPDCAPREMYNMMASCWTAKPLARPSFTKLSEQIGALLEDSLREYYISLNKPYLAMNSQRLESGKNDYLAMLSPPTFEVLSSPHYVNGHVGQDLMEDSGYISMSGVFSPRAEEGQVFDFNLRGVTKRKNSEDGTGPELQPMLQKPSTSDCDTALHSPTTPNSFSNPSYHVSSTKADNGVTDITRSDGSATTPQNNNNNYENSPKNRLILNVNSEKGNAHYVNNNTIDWQKVTL